MKLKVFKYWVFFMFLSLCLKGQNIIYGFVYDDITNSSLQYVKVLNVKGKLVSGTDKTGYFKFNTYLDTIQLVFSKNGYVEKTKNFIFDKNSKSIEFNTSLSLLSQDLEEVLIIEENPDLNDVKYQKDYSTDFIYSGKKNELIISSDKTGTSSNNARSMYNKVVSLNIVQTDNAGLQLNIGGRGLSPRRTSNFNVRQNNYDITPDPLGYPESYYIPAYESLENIELIRGAGALQYGTQFGGLINFNIKKPNLKKKFEIITRNSIGSYDLLSHFTSISGTINKFGYYTYYNHKKGNGFRPNSDFYSDNLYFYSSYSINEKSDLSFELTYLNYLAHQPGGLTDQMFNQDIYQSNRKRNWFSINWLLGNMKFNYLISKNTSIVISSYILDAYRYSIGFRPNRVNDFDANQERDLIKSNFNSFGFESKLIHNYSLFDFNMVSLFGLKIYSGENSTEQGPGSDGSDANFNFQNSLFPNYENQSFYLNPNSNYSFFGENIIYINDKMSLMPGFRYEYIKTASDGYYRQINLDAAGNLLLNNLVQSDNMRKRSFILFGIGYSFQIMDWSEFYSNLSQNYRAVTFADINTINPNFVINPNIQDEDGYTFDFGFRGKFKEYFSYDISFFHLSYNNRIGFVQKEFYDQIIGVRVKNEKGNVGDATILGNENLFNFNLNELLSFKSKLKINYFINLSHINSEYTNSDVNGVQGKEIEYVPEINLKTGFNLSYKTISTNIQYTFMSQQFTDATNSINGDLSGIVGEIPAYSILDLSIKCLLLNNIEIDFGINNLLNNYYFTTRATGYPGPGIMPSPTRNYYLTLEYKF